MARLVEEGYFDNIYEYYNDMSIRDLIEEALRNKRLSGYPERGALAARVEAIDSRFPTLVTDRPVIDSKGEWWSERLPKRAGGDLWEDMKSRCGYEAVRVE